MATLRYYLSGIVRAGNGTEEDPYFDTPAASLPGVSRSSIFPRVSGDGEYIPPVVLSLVRATEEQHAAIAGLPNVLALPELPFTAPFSALSLEEEIEMEEAVTGIGLSPAWDREGTWGEAVQSLAVQIEPSASVTSLYVA